VRTKADQPQGWAETQSGLLTANLVAGGFEACLQQAAPLHDSDLSAYYALTRDALSLACKWGAGNKGGALQTERALLAQATQLPSGFQDLAGAIYFLSNSPVFAPGRISWIALFTAVQNGDGAGMTAALHQLEPILQQ
jgi:hypothetical protein